MRPGSSSTRRPRTPRAASTTAASERNTPVGRVSPARYPASAAIHQRSRRRPRDIAAASAMNMASAYANVSTNAGGTIANNRAARCAVRRSSSIIVNRWSERARDQRGHVRDDHQRDAGIDERHRRDEPPEQRVQREEAQCLVRLEGVAVVRDASVEDAVRTRTVRTGSRSGRTPLRRTWIHNTDANHAATTMPRAMTQPGTAARDPEAAPRARVTARQVPGSARGLHARRTRQRSRR